MYLHQDLGFAEAYMNGDFHVNNLKMALDLWLDNRTHMGAISSLWNRCSTIVFTVHSLPQPVLE
ncbi:hypothetical protein IW261DRAFT_1431027 [Armillaria novae-zelandiae]|uniref:Uncharacterized protein n=1 Tax=Armillaria novae-zelandiae TaxID=153914 RepID=A0AA39TIB0_9AGAR|nr:hypothetical protein IW261DRAFT_1431027 [Armillaria novae-zelandiae]